MNDRITVGAMTLISGLAGGFGVLRAWPGATGRHRGPARPPVVPAPMLRPVEALDQFEEYCPAEDRPTLHIRLHTGGELCTECRNPDLTGGAA